MDKVGTATRPEDIFVELFAQVFGLEKAERLSHEFGVLDIYNQPRRIDDADFLPKRECVQFDLFEHQQETLDYLAQQRAMGKTMALVVHATGTGTTVTTINDARQIGLRTLYVAHTANLVKQTAMAFRQHWPEVHTGIYFGSRKETETHIVAATVQSLGRNLEKFSPDDFGYIIKDYLYTTVGTRHALRSW